MPADASLQERTLTPPKLARRYGVHVTKILTWIQAGELEAINIALKPTGRPRWRISEDAIATFELRRSSRATATPPVRRRRSYGGEPLKFF